MRLEDGRNFLYQWELSQKLEVPAGCVQVHFENGTFKGAMPVEVTHSVNSAEATIPNELLWTAATIKCYAWDGNKVIDHVEIAVQPREKPADYIYEETEVRRFDTLLEALEKNTVDDTKIGANPWSSKNTVDKLCPSFTESGGVVTCEPVVGYPLTVAAGEEATQIVRCGKNLFDFKQPVSLVYYTASDGGQSFRYGYSFVLPAGTYTMHAEPIGEVKNQYIYCYLNDLNDNYLSVEGFSYIKQGTKYYTRTFTLTEPAKVYIYNGLGTSSGGGDEASTNELFHDENNVQIEAGTEKTDYEPFCGEAFAVGVDIPAQEGLNCLYADRGSVTVSGKSDPVKIIEKLTTAIIAIGGTQ